MISDLCAGAYDRVLCVWTSASPNKINGDVDGTTKNKQSQVDANRFFFTFVCSVHS